MLRTHLKCFSRVFLKDRFFSILNISLALGIAVSILVLLILQYASVPQIIFLLYKDIMLLISIAAVFIIPLALYVTRWWMENFAYQVPLNYSLFAVAGIFALLFAFLAVAFHSLKTARTNPVESLKYE